MPTPRLVEFENADGRATPDELLARLRTLDSSVELVYFGARDWRLGAVRRTEQRRKAGVNILSFENRRAPGTRNVKNLYLGMLLTQGFAQIRQYLDHGDVAGLVTAQPDDEETTVFAHFEALCRAEQEDRDANFDANLAESMGASRKAHAQAALDEYLLNDARAHFRREVKGRVTFGHGGMTGGPGKGLIEHPGAFTPAGPLLTGEAAAEAMADMMTELAASL